MKVIITPQQSAYSFVSVRCAYTLILPKTDPLGPSLSRSVWRAIWLIRNKTPACSRNYTTVRWNVYRL